MLTGKNVLITGASGFIGSRLVEKLILEHGAHVRALVHNFSHVSRIARLPADELEMIAGDISDREGVESAVSGCDIVFDLAYDGNNPKLGIDGARNITDGCILHGVQHLVYTSSIAVYEPLPDGDLDESTTAEPSGWRYADSKLIAENQVMQYARDHGLPATVLNPTIVYGPYGVRWTDHVVKQLLSGQVYLPDEGQGLCNPVYVDDVVDAMILASENDAAVAERFMISGPAPVPWKDFYSAFEQVLGIESQVHMPADKIETLNQGITQNLRLMIRDPIRLMGWGPMRWKPVLGTIRYLRDRVGDAWMQKLLKRRLYIPDGGLLAHYSSHCHVRIDKARRVLGYEPKFDFNRGMKETAKFIRWAYLR